MEAIDAFARKNGFSEKKVTEIELALEEALVNIFSYAYPESEGDAELRMDIKDSGDMVMVLIDEGMAFDMLTLDEPDTTMEISERQVGGLGIFLIRKLMDQVKYRRENDRNILALVVKKEK